jgi:hypothetical protein
MPNLASLFPAMLAIQVTLAIALFVPSLLLPITLRGVHEAGAVVGR